MTAKTKDMIKQLSAIQLEHAAQEVSLGAAMTDGQHIAVAIHALALQVGEVASALGRIYMSLERK